MFKSVKYAVLKIIPCSITNALISLKSILNGDYLRLRRRLEDNERATRMITSLVLQQYSNQSHSYQTKSVINQHEARVYSQNGEDGILFYLFSILGTQTKRFVEFGIGNGKTCNTANLSINFGWSGLLMDISLINVIQAKSYYQQMLNDDVLNICILQARVTRENINDILKNNGFVGEIDLLSIDIDGNDYWVWQAINVINPMVVVIEYNASLGSKRALTIPYKADFNRLNIHPSGFYHGASLSALTKLGEEKGYVLIGCDSCGVNAIFVHKSAIKEKLKPLSAEAAYFPSIHRTQNLTISQQFNVVKHLPFEEV